MQLIMIQMIMMMILWISMYILKFKKKSNNKTMSPFECGYNSYHSNLPMSIQFTMLMFMFLLFDIELSILISSMKKILEVDKAWISTMFIFLLFMVISIIYEMTKKSFKWN